MLLQERMKSVHLVKGEILDLYFLLCHVPTRFKYATNFQVVRLSSVTTKLRMDSHSQQAL